MSISDSGSTNPRVVSSPCTFLQLSRPPFPPFPAVPIRVILDIVGEEHAEDEEKVESRNGEGKVGGVSEGSADNGDWAARECKECSESEGRGDEKSQPPSERRRAMRMASPGLCATHCISIIHTIVMSTGVLKDVLKRGPSCSRPGVKGVTRDAGCKRSSVTLGRPAAGPAGSCN